MNASSDNHPAILELTDVTKIYDLKGGAVRALDSVSLTVNEGAFMAVAGPSGSGKSTLLNLLGGLDTPTSGTITLLGREISSLGDRELARIRRDQIGFVFQAYNLIPVMTAVENVEYVMLLKGVNAKARRERAFEVLAKVGLAGMEHRMPAELSGGQQQRVAVARALASRPTLILADEPTANLDTHTGAGLLDTMAKINQEDRATFIFSTHDPRVMERSTRLVLLRDGRIESDTQK